ncbi:MAG: serine/threonine-protein kinase [Candidatus Obscuribacterales bacterium]|nr:serine/threonine-protein kinase [Candidatus Obscuribacterales bacterium]
MNEGFDETMKSRTRANAGALDIFVQGQVVAGKFKVISKLGSGGMGTVYRVEQIFLEKEFALKTMDHRTGSEVMIQRFQLEAKAAFSLNHPNLVKVHDYGILDNGNPYLVMDFINGMTFAEYLKQHGTLPIEYVAPLFAQACFGLMAAHEQSVVHRDIKPANLMLVNDVSLDAEGSVKLVDFGIAKLVNREEGEIQALTRTGEIFGSPLYMSPEQCSSGIVDHRSDIYSLGCVLFEMLTGTPPHMGQNALKTMLLHQAGETPTLKEASLGKDFPEDLERIVAKMLRKYPEQRYQNTGLVARDLTLLGSENRVTLRPPRPARKPQTVPVKVISMTSTRLYTFFALTFFLAALLAGSAVYFIRIAQTPLPPTANAVAKLPAATSVQKTTTIGELYPSPQAESKLAFSKTETTAKMFERLPPIQEEDVTIEKKLQHVYRFPTISVGDLCYYKSPLDFGEVIQPARGTVHIPVDTPIGIKISGLTAIPMLESPMIFKKIPGKDFKSLFFSYPIDTVSLTEEQSPAVIEKNVTAALQNLNGWTNIEAIHIKACPLNQDMFDVFNNFKKLHSLTIDRCKLDTKLLAKQAFLSRLTDFCLETCQYEDNSFINKLGRSSVLQRLVVDGPISITNLQDLKHCPKLITLQIGEPQINDGDITEICGMKQLRNLYLYHMVLSERQIKMIAECKWLRQISLSKSIYGDNADKVKALDSRIIFAE